MIHVSLDLSRCRGHQMCMIGAPDVFVDGGDVDGRSELVSTTLPDQRLADLEQVVASCPESAIQVLA